MKHSIYRVSGHSPTAFRTWAALDEASRRPDNYRAWVTAWHSVENCQLKLEALSVHIRPAHLGPRASDDSPLLLTTNPNDEEVVWGSIPNTTLSISELKAIKVFRGKPELKLSDSFAAFSSLESPILSAAVMSYSEALLRGDDVVESMIRAFRGVPEERLPDLSSVLATTKYEIHGSKESGWGLLALAAYSKYVLHVSKEEASFGDEAIGLFDFNSSLYTREYSFRELLTKLS